MRHTSGNFIAENPGLTAGSEHQRDEQPKAVYHFQVSYKYRRYWSGNTVLEAGKPIHELRFCPFCLDVIEHDERGWPYCLTCKTIFPLPRIETPRDAERLQKARAYRMRKFLPQIEAEDYAETRSRAGTKTKRQVHHKHRPGKGAKGRKFVGDIVP
jgi:hypothetical protein